MALLRIDPLTFFGKGVGNSLADRLFNIFWQGHLHKWPDRPFNIFFFGKDIGINGQRHCQKPQFISWLLGHDCPKFRSCPVRFRVCVSFRLWLERGASVDWLLVGWLALTCSPGPSASCWLVGGLEAHARPAVLCFRSSLALLRSFLAVRLSLSSYPPLVCMSRPLLPILKCTADFI